MAKKETAETPTDPSQAILSKAKDWPDWQRDALRRLAELGSLRDADRADMLAAIKFKHVLTTTPPPEAKPLGAEHLTNTAANQPRLSIEALSEAENVNLLKPGEKLDFKSDGITLIYGGNGSGKSGYTRIFKKACAARSAEDILANVFDPNYKTKSAATARFNIAETAGMTKTEESLTWAANAASPAKLRQVRVFDRKAAAIYVEGPAALAYVPYNLDLFDKLADECARLTETLKSEANAADAAYSTLTTSVPARGSAQINARTITATTTQAAIDAMAKWNPQDEARLAEATDLLERPTKAVAEVRAKKTRCDGLLSRINRLEVGLSKAKLDDLEARQTLVRDTQAASAATSKDSFSQDAELLPGVGGGPWRELWKAARSYSTQAAYPGTDFPVTAETGGKEPRCVLCHQPLSEDACGRLKGFEEFVRGDVANRAAEAETKLAEAMRAIDALSPALSTEDEALLGELKTDAPETAAKVSKFFAEATTRKNDITNSAILGDLMTIAAEPTPCSAELKKLVDALDAKIREIEASLTPETKKALRHEQADLVTKKTLAEHKPTLQQLIENRLLKKKLDECIKDVGTKAITDAKAKLNQLFVDDLFKATLKTELEAIRVSRTVTLDFKVTKGIAYQRAVFGDSAFPNLDQVLSEGEHRAVAIACFLAEAKMLGDHQPLVIDDPVSSLDHERRLRVTKRLVAEAKKRQVVIFTHDMVFWAEVEREAQEAQVPLLVKDVRTEGGLCGKVGEGDTPWINLSVPLKLKYLEDKLLPDLKNFDSKSQEFEDRARLIGEKLRETWERLVEEGILQSTVVRFRHSVETQRLDMVQVLDEDWEKVYKGVSRTSGWSHDNARATAAPPPEIDDLKKEVEEIRTLSKKLKKDGEKLRAARRARLESPGVGTVIATVGPSGDGDKADGATASGASH
ncbi:MAG: AAA family ATPase [Elusimicrobia bacterium]|nr:AAA family ATPase [Elusimicrobiota bacterium]